MPTTNFVPLSTAEVTALTEGTPVETATLSIVPPSPNSSLVKNVGALIVDDAGNSYQINSNNVIAINGTADTRTANVVALAYVVPLLWQQNAAGEWYSIAGPTGAWSAGTLVNPITGVAPPTESPTGTIVLQGSSAVITDAALNTYGISSSNVITINGQPDTRTANVIELEWLPPLLWQKNAAGAWYSISSPTAAWQGPYTAIPGTGTTTLPAPTNFTLTAQTANSSSFSWSPVQGAASYNIYRAIGQSGAYSVIGNTTETTFIDSNAPNTLYTGVNAPATIYCYQIAALDANDNLSAVQTSLTAWMYHNGTMYWEGDYSNVTADYSDTTGAPTDGPCCISISGSGSPGYYQPYSGTPFCPQWAMEIGQFNFMILKIKVIDPAVLNYLKLNIISRLPQGDVFNNASVMLTGNPAFPALTVGQWVSFKVPFTALGIGIGTIVGGINGDVLTVTSDEGVFVQATDWVFGGGLSAPLAINSASNASNGPGTYDLSGTANIPANTTFGIQRSNMYKYSLLEQCTSSGKRYYLEDVGFTTT